MAARERPHLSVRRGLLFICDRAEKSVTILANRVTLPGLGEDHLGRFMSTPDTKLLAGVRGSRTHLPRSSRGITDLKSLPKAALDTESPTLLITNDELISKFLNDRRSRGLSRRTVQFYQGYLTRFLAHLSKPLLAVTKGDIATFLDGLTCTPGGKHAYLRALRALYAWAEESELIGLGRNLCSKVMIKVPKPLRYAVKLGDIPRLLDAADNVRDKHIISILADTGLRRAELCSVKWTDVHQEQDTIQVWGKGAKERLVRYGPLTRRLLDAWRKECGGSHGSLLGLKPTGLQDVLKRIQTRTDIQCNAHAFRRTFAVESVRNGLNLFYVQSLLGHASLTITRIYADQVSSEDAIKAYRPIVT